jgi:hypothetical protein
MALCWPIKMTLGYVTSTTIMNLFSYNFHKSKETLLNFSKLEKLKAQRMCRRTGAAKNANVVPSAPVDGKGIIIL